MNTKSCFSILILAILIAVLPNGLSCQYVIDWAKTYGGSGGHNNAYKVRQTNDGGYIMAGYSDSGDGDLTGNHGDWDYWIMKLDSRGKIEWSKNYGGSGVDSANDVLETDDGGFLVIGHSNSTDGDVSENIGGYDCWVLKLNEQGELVWQKSFGGSDNDNCNSLSQTTEGDFIFTGSTYSSDGDLAGNNGISDWWVVKFDTKGKLIWSNNYGGIDNFERAGKFLMLQDETLIISGFCSSDGGLIGTYDAWIAKLRQNGEFVWSKKFGGPLGDFPEDIKLDLNGNIVGVGTFNENHIDGLFYGDIQVFHFNTEGQDISESRTYGGSKTDSGTGIQPLPNGDFLVAGISASSDGDVSSNYGNFDWWLFVIDKAGKLKWEKNYGGSWGDLLYSIEPTADGGFILAGHTSSKDGDVVADYDGELAWVVKLRPENTTGACGKPYLYPNPASNGVVKIEVKEGFGKNGSLEIFDVTGRTVLMLPSSQLANKSIVEISVADLPCAGIYFIRTNCGEETHVDKFVRL